MNILDRNLTQYIMCMDIFQTTDKDMDTFIKKRHLELDLVDVQSTRGYENYLKIPTNKQGHFFILKLN